MTFSNLRTSAGLVAAAVAITGATLAVDTNRAAVIDAVSPSTWVSSAAVDAATRVGPGGAQVTVALGDVRGHLQVVDLDGVAYAVDGTGQFSRIDPATFEVSVGPSMPGVELVAGGGALYALDRDVAEATALDPATLDALSAPIDVGDEPGAAIVDDAGVLWVIDEASGVIVRVAGAERRDPVAAVAPGTPARLSQVESEIVLVDPVAGAVVVLDDSAAAARTYELDAFERRDVRVPSGVANGSVLPVLDGDRLVLVDVTDGTTRSVDLGRSTNELGTPAVAAGFAHVPDFTKGELLSVSLADAALVEGRGLDGVGDEFDVVAKGDYVYVNDPANQLAWVIGPDGTLTPVDKYDPDDPGTGDVTLEVPPAPQPPELPDVVDPPTTVSPDPETVGPDPATAEPPETLAPDPQAPVPGQERDPGGDPNDPGDGGTLDDGPDTSEPCPTDSRDPACTPTPEPCADGYGGDCPAPGDGAVSGVTATAGDAQLTASWAPPQDWYEVIGYRVTVVPDGDPANAIGPTQVGTVTEFSQDGLRNGRRYYVVVEALGEHGERGPAVASALVMPISDDPGQPGAVTLTVEACGDLAISWSAPDDGFDVAGYRVEVTATGSPGWTGDVTSTSAAVPAASLVLGVPHTVTVYSVDAAGETSPPADGGSGVPHCVPEPPGAVAAQASGDGEILVSWTAADDNGAAVDGYEIAYSTGGGASSTTQTAGDATSAAVGGLTNGSTYDVRARARNADGWGPWSPSTPVLIQSHTPDMPGSLSATPGDQAVTLSWSASAGNGTTVTGYTVEIIGGAATTVTTTSHVFSGLTNGTPYDFRVRANGANGNVSGWATVGPETPAGAPGTPTGIGAVAGDGTVTLSWAPASGNGTTIERYEIRGGSVSTQSTTSPHAVTGLSNGTSYAFEIRAVGANGVPGAWAGAPAATPSGAPAAPAGVGATATSPHDATVTFSQVSPTNGTTVGQWRVTTSPASTTQVVGSPIASLTGLDALTSYTVHVVAIGANGMESAAATTTFSTPNGVVPGALTGLSVMGGRWYANQTCGEPANASWDPTPGADGYTVSVSPYGGSQNQTWNGWSDTPPPGDYTITVTPYNLYGTGAPMSRSFSMIDHGSMLCP